MWEVTGDRDILDLCGGSGGWSLPYRQAGYPVYIVDPAADRKVLEDKGYFVFGGTVQEYWQDIKQDAKAHGGAAIHYHGVLAAPPCTEFSGSGARWWAKKAQENPDLLELAINNVLTCLCITRAVEPTWWALENPVGRIQRVVPEIGKRGLVFQPWEYGDWMKKRTCLYGDFDLPKKLDNPKKPGPDEANDIWLMSPSADRASKRAVTPPKFAKAFMRANP